MRVVAVLAGFVAAAIVSACADDSHSLRVVAPERSDVWISGGTEADRRDLRAALEAMHLPRARVALTRMNDGRRVVEIEIACDRLTRWKALIASGAFAATRPRPIGRIEVVTPTQCRWRSEQIAGNNVARTRSAATLREIEDALEPNDSAAGIRVLRTVTYRPYGYAVLVTIEFTDDGCAPLPRLSRRLLDGARIEGFYFEAVDENGEPLEAAVWAARVAKGSYHGRYACRVG